jgi:ribosomal protein L7/L12
MPGEYSQATLAAHFEETNQRLADIETQLALVSEKLGLPYTAPAAVVPPDVVELARAGKQLEAIKRYRELTGASMDDARSVVVGL